MKLLGYPVDEWYGATFWIEHVHPEDRTRAEHFWKSDLPCDVSDFELEYRMVAADGRTVWVRDIVHVSHLEGDIQVYHGFIRDITEQQRAKEEIAKSQQQLRALSALLQSAREEERIHNAREIHDELGGALTSLKMDLSRIETAIPNSCAGCRESCHRAVSLNVAVD